MIMSMQVVRLGELAHARSGDKGNTSNISVIAYDEAFNPFIKEQLTADRFLAHYAGTIHGPVQRYEVDGLAALTPMISVGFSTI